MVFQYFFFFFGRNEQIKCQHFQTGPLISYCVSSPNWKPNFIAIHLRKMVKNFLFRLTIFAYLNIIFPHHFDNGFSHQIGLPCCSIEHFIQVRKMHEVSNSIFNPPFRVYQNFILIAITYPKRMKHQEVKNQNKKKTGNDW